MKTMFTEEANVMNIITIRKEFNTTVNHIKENGLGHLMKHELRAHMALVTRSEEPRAHMV